MNTLLLQPTDVLFFRDGRPMDGSLAGHGAAWPLPTVVDGALHSALHRAMLLGHDHAQRSPTQPTAGDARSRTYGSLVTAGPFPVNPAGQWFFPRPLDLGGATLAPTLRPQAGDWLGNSSLRPPLKHAIVNVGKASKDLVAKAWLSADAYERYLTSSAPNELALRAGEAYDDAEFSDPEATIGIGIDPRTQTQDGDRFYSARYLRLRDSWRMGILAKTSEKRNGDRHIREDLVAKLFQRPGHIVAGGQQRVCSARIESANSQLHLPRGLTSDFGSQHLVKWVLLSPAIWPRMEKRSDPEIPAHSGGWLPNWIRETDGKVMLRSGERRARSYDGKHARGFSSSDEIDAHLVAALVPKPVVVTGWALPHPAAGRPEGGAKSTHLAVPAGAVYYFKCTTAAEAGKLATVLNWNGSETNPITIKNRRSTLLGEKGFGLGVCGTWDFPRDSAG